MKIAVLKDSSGKPSSTVTVSALTIATTMGCVVYQVATSQPVDGSLVGIFTASGAWMLGRDKIPQQTNDDEEEFGE